MEIHGSGRRLADTSPSGSALGFQGQLSGLGPQ